MAKTITDEQIKLSIIINGNAAQKQLLDLEKGTKKLTDEKKNLQIELRRVETELGKDSAAYKKLSAEIKQTTNTIDNNKATMRELQNQIGLTGLTMNQLTQKANLLKLSLRNVIPGSDDYKKYDSELNAVKDRMSELNGKAAQSKLSISSLADGFNKYAALGASVVAGLTGVVFSVQKIIDLNGKLSDSQADVMKTTGMSKKEVDELTKSFGLLETRTSRIDLLKIAEQGGRLGVPKAEIQDFVKSMNMAAVALGDSFTGGVDEVAEKLGKIKFLFKETKDMGIDQAYNSIGSAINDLGANGTASEANIAEFTKRIGSLTDVLKPTVQETLALGTAFEESGIEAETSSRAYNIFMKQASTESGKFAQVMGISKKAVEDMINTNPMNFMLDFAKGMNGMNATEVAKTLDFLGVNADGANKVIGAMGNNFGRFHELIDLSNASFKSGISLTNEYNVKNETLGATLEKIGKNISGFFTNQGFINWLTNAVAWFAKFIGATEDADGSVAAWRSTLLFAAKVIAIVTAAIVTNVGWQKLVVIWTERSTTANLLYSVGEKARAFWTGVTTIATEAQALAVALATGNTIAAKNATNALSLAMKTTPWGFILAALSAIAVAYVAFSEKVSIAVEVQKTLSEVHNEATKSIAKEKAELDLLVKIAQDETVSKEKRLLAVKKLNEISPEYLKNLTLENINTSEGIGLMKLYTDELYKNARAKSVQKKFDALSDQKIDIENKNSKDYRSSVSSAMSYVTGQDDGVEFKNRKEIENYVLKTFGSQIGLRKDKTTGVNLVNKEKFKQLVERYVQAYNIDEKEKELSVVDAQMKALEPEITKNTVADLGKESSVEKSNYKVPVGKDDKKSKDDKPKKYDDSYLADEAKALEELYQIQVIARENRIALMQDGYEKDLQLDQLALVKKIHSHELSNKAIDVLQLKLQNDLIQAKKDGDTKQVASIQNQQKLLSAKQIANNELICDEEKIQVGRIAIIEERAAKKQLDDSKEAYDQQKLQRETAFLNELNSKERSEEEKKRLTEEFNAKEIEFDKQFLRKKIEELNAIIAGGIINGVDFDLLDEKQKKKLLADVELAKNALAKLEAAKNGKSDGTELDLGLAKKGDILGFSQETWDKFFLNIANGAIGFQTMTMAIMAATAVFSEIDKYQTASENNRLKKEEKNTNAQKVRLKKQLDSGVISQAQYNRKVEKLDNDLDAKKQKIEYDQAKRQRIIAIATIITNTAAAIMGIWKDVPKVDFGVSAGILTAIVGGLGLAQIATVMATDLPGAEEGLYGDYVTRQQDKKRFKVDKRQSLQSGLFSKPTVLVGEGGDNYPEMVIDSKAWRQMSPEVKNAVVNEIRGVKGYEAGLYNQSVTQYTQPSNATTTANSNNDNAIMQMMMSMMQENMSLLKDLRENGLLARVDSNDLQGMKKLKDGIKNFDSLRNSNKV